MPKNKLTNKELTHLLDQARKANEDLNITISDLRSKLRNAADDHLAAIHELNMVTRDAKQDSDKIKSLKIDLALAKETIARMAMNETVQLEMEDE
jgi:hypothetical protein